MERKPLILIVDDEPDFRELVGAVLLSAGYEVITASNGEAALGLYAKTAVDLILLDDRLPDSDGLEVCRSIRASPPRPDVPILLCSASHLDARAAGASGYLRKPFETSELLKRVAGLLAGGPRG